MEFFAISCLSSITFVKYMKLYRSASKPIVEIPDSLEGIRGSVEEIFNKHTFVPALYSIFDYHGQLQTSIQTAVRIHYITHAWMGSLLGLRPNVINYERELLTMSDGGTVGLDWASLHIPEEEKPVTNLGLVLINHGVLGNSGSEYIVFQVQKLLKAGFSVVVLNARGCGGIPITSSKFFLGDKSNDCLEVVNYLKRTKAKDTSLYLLGFSMGAATSLKYLGNVGNASPVVAAVAISPPWDFDKGGTEVGTLWGFIISLGLKFYILWNFGALKKSGALLADLKDVLLSKGLKDMDEHLVGAFGYSNTDDYRRDLSPIHVAGNITVPTLSISAVDDPVCPVSAVPHPHNRGCGLITVSTPIGGHISFPKQSFFPFTTDSWTEDIVVEWFKLNAVKNNDAVCVLPKSRYSNSTV